MATGAIRSPESSIQVNAEYFRQLRGLDKGTRAKHASVIDYYDSFADSYNETYLDPVFEQIHQRCDGTYLQIIRPEHRVIEIGCSAGRELILIAQKCKHVVGVDVSRGMLEEAERNVRKAGVTENVQLVHTGAADIPFPDAHFDVYLALFGTMNHMVDVDAALKEMERVVRPEGSAIIYITNRFAASLLVKSMLWPTRHNLRRIRSRLTCGELYWTNYLGGKLRRSWYREYSLNEVRELLRGLAFEIQTVRGLPVIAWLYPFRFLNSRGWSTGRIQSAWVRATKGVDDMLGRFPVTRLVANGFLVHLRRQ